MIAKGEWDVSKIHLLHAIYPLQNMKKMAVICYIFY